LALHSDFVKHLYSGWPLLAEDKGGFDTLTLMILSIQVTLKFCYVIIVFVTLVESFPLVKFASFSSVLLAFGLKLHVIGFVGISKQ
jgi:hypothetical protein